MRRRLAGFTTLVAVLLLVPGSASAHPLGNFTINHHLGVHITPNVIALDLVIDMAEIPAFQEQQAVDLDRSGDLSIAETVAYAASKCLDLRSGLSLKVDSVGLAIRSVGSLVALSPGQAGLNTLRLECSYEGDIALLQGQPVRIDVANHTFEHRIGWREVVATSSGVSLETELPSVSPTDDLRAYQDPDRTPLDDRGGVIRATATGAPFVVDNGAIPARGVSRTPSVLATPSIPGPTGVLGSLVAGGNLGTGALLFGLLAAFGLGLTHALAPGHGKTLTAAYLIGSRGSVRHAVALGLAVAVSHTIGVAALGVLALGAAATFQPDRVYPYLSAVSAVIILGVGAALVRKVVRRRRAHDHTNGHDHDHGHSHDHPVAAAVSWKSLAALGLSGGLVPSASAVVLLLGAIHLGRVELGLILIFVFGLGMSTALVGAGIGVVAAQRLGLRVMGKHRIGRQLATAAVPVAAFAITGIGLAMTISSVQALLPG